LVTVMGLMYGRLEGWKHTWMDEWTHKQEQRIGMETISLNNKTPTY